MSTGFTTHEVLNQPPPLEGYDVVGADAALLEGVVRERAAWALDDLHELGRLAGSAEAIGWGFQANASTPVLRTHDRYGHRVDEVDYHPAYHQLMATSIHYGLHGAPWADERPGAHVASCRRLPHVVPGRRRAPLPDLHDLQRRPRAARAARRGRRLGPGPDLVASTTPGSFPRPASAASPCGMAMTEKQGGCDVRANTTAAEPTGVGSASTC